MPNHCAQSLKLATTTLVFLSVAYANLLYNWQFFQKRCEVLKRSNQPPSVTSDLGEVEISITCPCQDTRSKPEQPITFSSNPGKCTNCQRRSLVCLLCGLPVRGLATVCFVCGHGGHLDHLQQWFQLPQSKQRCGAPGRFRTSFFCCDCYRLSTEPLGLL